MKFTLPRKMGMKQCSNSVGLRRLLSVVPQFQYLVLLEFQTYVIIHFHHHEECPVINVYRFYANIWPMLGEPLWINKRLLTV